MFRLLQYTINIYCNDDRLKISVPNKMWRFLFIFINYPATLNTSETSQAKLMNYTNLHLQLTLRKGC